MIGITPYGKRLKRIKRAGKIGLLYKISNRLMMKGNDLYDPAPGEKEQSAKDFSEHYNYNS